MEHTLDRQEAVAEIRLGRRAGADPRRRPRRAGRARARRRASRARPSCAGRGSRSRRAARSGARRARRGTPRSRAAARRRGRAAAARAPARSAPSSSSQSRGHARTEWGATPTRMPRVAQLLELAKVLGDRLLPEAVDAAARVGDVEQHDLDARLGRRLGGGVRLREPEVVELADGRVARVAQLPVDRGVALADTSRCLTPGQVQHGLAPRPEVRALGPAAQRRAGTRGSARRRSRGVGICPPRARGYARAAAPPGRGAGRGVSLPCLRSRAPERSRSSTTRGTGRRRATAPGSTGTRTATGRRATSTRASTRRAARTRAATRASSTQQMAQIAAAGVDEVVVSWWGRGSVEDARLPLVLARGAPARAPRRRSTSSRTPDRSPATVARRSRVRRGARRSATSTSTTRATSRPPTGRRVPAAGAADAAAASPAPSSSASRRRRTSTASTRTTSSTTAAASSRGCARRRTRCTSLCAPSVGPGYDGRRAGEAAGGRQRANGTTYDRLWTAALAATPDIVTITSYNEWGEGTQIEPAAAAPRLPPRTTAPGASPAPPPRTRT